MLNKQNWLSARLSPARQTSPIWREIMETVEEWQASQVFPKIERLKHARKTFSDDDEALNRLINELGDFFEVPEIDDNTRGKQKHLDLLWRRHELHKKRTTVAFDSYVNRVLSLHGLDAKWMPLYWRKKDDYATCTFFPKLREFESLCELLSSRGAIFLDLDTVPIGHSSEWLVERMDLAYKRARKIIPEHLVIDAGIVQRKVITEKTRIQAVVNKAWVYANGTNQGDINTAHADVDIGNVAFSHSIAPPLAHKTSTNRGDANQAIIDTGFDKKIFFSTANPAIQHAPTTNVKSMMIVQGSGKTNT